MADVVPCSFGMDQDAALLLLPGFTEAEAAEMDFLMSSPAFPQVSTPWLRAHQ